MTLCLRIGVRQGGCSGMSYIVDFEDQSKVRSDDSIIEADGIKLGMSLGNDQRLKWAEKDNTSLLVHKLIGSAQYSTGFIADWGAPDHFAVMIQNILWPKHGKRGWII